MARKGEDAGPVAPQETNALLGDEDEAVGEEREGGNASGLKGHRWKFAAFLATLPLAGALLVTTDRRGWLARRPIEPDLQDEQVASELGPVRSLLVSFPATGAGNSSAGSTASSGRRPAPAPLQLLQKYVLEVTTLTYGCTGAEAVGGYVWCADVAEHPGQPCTLLAYGMVEEDSFEQEVARWGCQVYEFDPKLALTEGSRSSPERIHLHKVGLSSRPGVIHGLGIVDSLQNHLNRYCEHWYAKTVRDKGWLALRLDVEEAEWIALSAAPDLVFEKVDVLIVKFHCDTDDPKLIESLPKRIETLRRLKDFFYVYHVQASDWRASADLLPRGRGKLRSEPPLADHAGYYLPASAELSFVRKTSVPKGPLPEASSDSVTPDAPLPSSGTVAPDALHAQRYPHSFPFEDHH